MAKLDKEQQLAKNAKVKAKIKETNLRRKSQQCFSRELKINTSEMNKLEREQLKMLFVEAKWIRNNILASDNIKDYKVKGLTSVKGLDKNKKEELKPIQYLSSHMLQDVYAQVKQDISSLAAKKSKGRKVGRLKFVSEVNSINLKQIGNTYDIRSNGVKIQGFKRLLKVFGLKQLSQYPCEFANAKLIKKASGYYIHVMFFVNKENVKKPKTNNSVGLDFGIKTAITTSDGDKFNISIKESDSLKKAQRSLSRKQKGSNNRYRARFKVRLAYEKITNKRQDKANQIVGFLTSNYSSIYMQDENLRGWHKGLFGKQVQNSALGTIKSKLIAKKAILIDRFAPTTKECLYCGTHVTLSLADRVFSCECGYSEDRDIKAALTVLSFGIQGKYLKIKKSTDGTSET